MTSDEQWRPIPGWDGLYEVSDFGRVLSRRSHTPRVLKQFMSTDGYPCVNLGRDNQRRVHLLVLEAFVGPTPRGMEGCHRNGDQTDPRLTNLRWGTHSSNMLDKVRHGTHHEASKTHCPKEHPYDEANTYVEPRTGKRYCRTCRRARMSVYPAKSQRGRSARDPGRAA